VESIDEGSLSIETWHGERVFEVGDQVVALVLQSEGRLEARWVAVISE
jgi:hypothetical protein